MKHFISAARAGEFVKKEFTKGFVTKVELEQALCAYQKGSDEMKSEAREARLQLLFITEYVE